MWCYQRQWEVRLFHYVQNKAAPGSVSLYNTQLKIIKMSNVGTRGSQRELQQINLNSNTS